VFGAEPEAFDAGRDRLIERLLQFPLAFSNCSRDVTAGSSECFLDLTGPWYRWPVGGFRCLL